MPSPLTRLRAAVALLLSACLLCPPARALVTFNDGKEHLFITGTAGVSYNSNIYARAGGSSDTIYSAGVLLEYTRRAGLIGVNGSLGLDLSQFTDNRDENFLNPRFGLEFVKTTGRTTGELSLSAARENRADTAANIREQSWDYSAGLHFKYPVIDRYSISGNLAYDSREYGAGSGLTDLHTYTVGADLLYALTEQRDLMAGYAYRYSETSANSAYDDHSFTVGVTGRIITHLNGTIRAGYQVRRPHGATVDGDYRGLTASGSLNWAVSKKLSFTGLLTKDTSVTSTDISIDSLSANLDAQYVFNAKLSVFANVGGGDSKFLGAIGNNRRDQFFTFGAGVNYTMMQQFKATLAYTYFENWSTLSFADYDRNTLTLSLSSRW